VVRVVAAVRAAAAVRVVAAVRAVRAAAEVLSVRVVTAAAVAMAIAALVTTADATRAALRVLVCIRSFDPASGLGLDAARHPAPATAESRCPIRGRPDN